MESSQLRRISIIGISVLCLSPIEFFSNQLFEDRKVETAQVVISEDEMKLKPNYLSNNYEIFNPEIKTTSEDIEKLVNENKEKEIIEYENKLELEKAKKAEEEKRRQEEEKRKEEERRKQEERKRAEKVYRETSSSTNQEVQKYTNNAQVKEVSGTVPQPNTEVATNLVNYALQFVGNPYVSNGTDLYNGVDCSGFTMKVYEHFGYSLPHRSTVQATYGTSVSINEMVPGDLIFYGYNGKVSHVALYIGNGQIVHAATSQLGIVTGGYNLSMPIITVRRILN